jgi:hypothetical protein
MDDQNNLKTVFLEALREHHESVIDAHAAHHEWIQERIEVEKVRKEMISKVTDAAIQWSVVGLLGAAWYFIQEHVKL